MNKVKMFGKEYEIQTFQELPREPLDDGMVPCVICGVSGRIEKAPRADGRTHGILNDGTEFSMIVHSA